MSINKPTADKMIRPADTRNKSMKRVNVKILKPFVYNGMMLQTGDVAEMNDERAVNHMRAGDVERDEGLINEIKERRTAAAEAAMDDAKGDW